MVELLTKENKFLGSIMIKNAIINFFIPKQLHLISSNNILIIPNLIFFGMSKLVFFNISCCDSIINIKLAQKYIPLHVEITRDNGKCIGNNSFIKLILCLINVEKYFGIQISFIKRTFC